MSITTPSRNAGIHDVPQWWGMAGVFPGDLGVYEGDAWANKLDFVAERGFHGSGTAVTTLQEPERFEKLSALAKNSAQAFSVHYGIDLRADPESETKRLLDSVKIHISKLSECPLPLALFVVSNPMHRFDRDLSLETQLDRLTGILRPAVEALAEAGIKPVIENHGDYYVSDLVGLCQRIPGLQILLDTGNCFLIGERLDLIPESAYPLIGATHLKDHWVYPVAKGLTFQLKGATLGQGHAGLTAFYHKLIALHPDPRSIHIMIEWVPDPDKAVIECFNQSLKYLADLSAGTFTPNYIK